MLPISSNNVLIHYAIVRSENPESTALSLIPYCNYCLPADSAAVVMISFVITAFSFFSDTAEILRFLLSRYKH